MAVKPSLFRSRCRETKAPLSDGQSRTGSPLFIAWIILSRTDLARAIASYFLDFFFFFAAFFAVFFLAGDFDFLAAFLGIIFLAVLLTFLNG